MKLQQCNILDSMLFYTLAMSMRYTLTIYSEDLIVSKKHILQSNCAINSDWQPSEDFFLPVKSSLIIIIKWKKKKKIQETNTCFLEYQSCFSPFPFSVDIPLSKETISLDFYSTSILYKSSQWSCNPQMTWVSFGLKMNVNVKSIRYKKKDSCGGRIGEHKEKEWCR